MSATPEEEPPYGHWEADSVLWHLFQAPVDRAYSLVAAQTAAPLQNRTWILVRPANTMIGLVKAQLRERMGK